MTNQKKINIVLEDDFGRVQTIIKTDLTPSDLMDKILEIVDDWKMFLSINYPNHFLVCSDFKKVLTIWKHKNN